MMRLFRVLSAAAAVLLVTPSFAEEWADFTSIEDGFRVHAPCTFALEKTTFTSEYDAVLPEHIYSCESSSGRYSVTVRDYTDAKAVHAARTGRTEADYVDIYWEVDVRASVAYAAMQLRQRGGKVTYDGYHYIDRVEGMQIQMTNEDKTRTYAGIYLNDSRLYIFEATVGARTPPPGIFQQSLEFVDAQGKRIRYPNFAEAVKVRDAPTRERESERQRLQRERGNGAGEY
jgi:hypothetical protein